MTSIEKNCVYRYKNENYKYKKKIKILSYMTPSLSTEIYLIIAEYVVKYLEYSEVILYIETNYSGPSNNEVNPFIEQEGISIFPIDIGFMCSPPYVKNRKYLELVPYAPIFIDKMIDNKPLYFSDVITLKEYESIHSFKDLKDKRWVYNDEESLSGRFSTIFELYKMNKDITFFSEFIKSGSHINSIKALLNNKTDGTAIDSNVLNYYFLKYPDDRKKIKIIERWGPYGIQPIVMRKTLDIELKSKIIEAFRNIPKDVIKKLEYFLINKFGKIDDSFYKNEIEMLKTIGYLDNM